MPTFSFAADNPQTMPSPAASSSSSSSSVSVGDGGLPAIVSRLSSGDPDIKLKALREVKNQIIGNKTKKLNFLKLGAVPLVTSILSAEISDAEGFRSAPRTSVPGMLGYSSNVVVQSAAALGSFACGFDDGAQAVLSAGAMPLLIRLLSHPDAKVVGAGARSLRMIYQSELAPKYQLLEHRNLEFLVSLLNSEGVNVTELGASIIAHSCRTNAEQKALLEAGILKRLINLLDGTLGQRDASLGSLAAVFRENAEVITKFFGLHGGKPLNSISYLTQDANPKTRLLACQCLIIIRNATDGYLQELGFKCKLVNTLVELLDDPGQVGDESPYVFSSLIGGKEDLQKIALEAGAIRKLRDCMKTDQVNPRRLRGVLLALADLCSKLESCRLAALSLEVLNPLIGFLGHKDEEMRISACACLRNVTRSIKNAVQKLCAGYFMKNEALVTALIQLLMDASEDVQVAALAVVSNIVVDFASHKTTFLAHGGLQQLLSLSKSMIPAVRSNSLWALRNMTFLADNKCKEAVALGMTTSLISSLICDSEPFVKEQALGFVRNLVDGSSESIEHVLSDDGIVLEAVGRQLRGCSKTEAWIQGMYVLVNIACGNESHKEAVMEQLFPQVENETGSFIVNFLVDADSRLRIAAVWTLINLTFPSSTGAVNRLTKLQNSGVMPLVRNMVNDPCLDVKLRVRTLLTQAMCFGNV
ncbi:Armadillo repeat-containing protein 8 [Linum grandiflorum]